MSAALTPTVPTGMTACRAVRDDSERGLSRGAGEGEKGKALSRSAGEGGTKTLLERVRAEWGGEIAPCGGELSYRTWTSPFAIEGMGAFVEDLRQVVGVALPAAPGGWQEQCRAFVSNLLAWEPVPINPDGKPLTVTELGLECGGRRLEAAGSVPFLILQLAQALCFTSSELYNRTLVAYDLETTGLSGRDEITEIGAVKLRNGVVIDEFQTLVNPGQRIGPAIVELTGITNEMVSTAPAPEVAVKRFLEFFGGNETVAVVHNGGMDLSFIRRRARRVANRVFAPRVFDTRSFCQSVRPLISVNLNDLARDFGVALTDQHRALADAKATGEIFVKAWSIQNIRYQRFLRENLRCFALAAAAWPGAEGEAERTILNHLFRHPKPYRWWPGLAAVGNATFHRYRDQLARVAGTVLAGGEVTLAPAAGGGVPAIPAALGEFTARFVTEFEGYQPHLRHNPAPVFILRHARPAKEGTALTENGRTIPVRGPLPSPGPDGYRVTPVLQPHWLIGWLWPGVAVEAVS